MRRNVQRAVADSNAQEVSGRSFVRLTFRAERLRPAAQLMQNKLADWRAEVRSSAELGGQACSLRQIFADQLAKLASGLRTEVSLRKNLEYATSHED